MKKLVFREDVLAWNYMLDDARKLAKERKVKFSKRQLELVLICQKTLLQKTVQVKG